MKHQKWGKPLLGLLLVCALAFGYLELSGRIGLPEAKLEADIRASQKIAADWTVTGEAADTLAAYLSYPEDRSDHTFSVYVNRPGLSFGYFFRSGGSLSGVAEGLVEVRVEGYAQRAFLSMNRQQVDYAEVDDGRTDRIIDLDSEKPFALVLPVNGGEVTFYDIHGNRVEISTRYL